METVAHTKHLVIFAENAYDIFSLLKSMKQGKNIAKLGENESLKNWTPEMWYNVSICLWKYANKMKQSPLGSHKQDVL